MKYTALLRLLLPVGLLENNVSFVVTARLKKHGEVVNDHQVAIAQRFEQLGHILAAYS